MKARSLLLSLALGCASFGPVLLPACSANPPGDASPAEEPREGVDRAAVQAAPPSAPPRRVRGVRLRDTGNHPVDESKRFTAGPNPICRAPKLQYFDGPIVQSPTVVPVYWNSSVNAQVQQNMSNFFADVMASSYWTWLHEYDTVAQTGGTAQVILPGTSAAGVVLKPSVCPGATRCNMTDADIQNELNSQIASGTLPEPTLDCTGNTNTIYMVYFPPAVIVSGPQGAGQSCNQFCGYHNTGTISSGAANGKPLLYGALFDTFSGACATGCGSPTSPLAVEESLSSHELVEAVTDPDIGLDTQNGYAKPAGWGDNNNLCGEIGDICAAASNETATITGAHGSWTVQYLWSNKQNACVVNGPVPPVCSGTTTTNCRICACGDNGGACNGGTSVCETTAGNVLHGACEQCTATDTTPCNGGTCTQSSTPAQDDVCTGGCMPITSCPAGDNCGTISNGCGGTVTCGTGTCPSGETCGGGGTANVCGSTCTPLRVCPAPDDCGTISDGCGGMLNCGTCTGTQSCGGGGTPNVCGSGTCIPLATCPTGDNCGTISNNCGGMLFCGTCAAGQTCTNNVCSNTCVPLSTCPAGDNCGTISNGCGGMLSCGGACPTGETCGGGGTPNVCGGSCTPATTCPRGQTCGTAPDGCGGTITCGTCTGFNTCGGGGTPGQCGCTPLTACPAGSVCGDINDTCGGAVLCGFCPTGQTCLANNTCSGGGSSTSSSGATSTSAGAGGGAGSTSSSGGTGGSTGSTSSGSAGAGAGGGAGSTSSSSGSGFGGSLGAGGSGSSSGNGASTSTTGTGASPVIAPGQNKGCGCRVAGDDGGSSSSSLSAFGLLALVGALRARRRRAA